MSATLVGTLVALALLVIVVVFAAEWSLRHRTRRSGTGRSDTGRSDTGRSDTRAPSPPTGRGVRR